MGQGCQSLTSSIKRGLKGPISRVLNPTGISPPLPVRQDVSPVRMCRHSLQAPGWSLSGQRPGPGLCGLSLVAGLPSRLQDMLGVRRPEGWGPSEEPAARASPSAAPAPFHRSPLGQPPVPSGGGAPDSSPSPSLAAPTQRGPRRGRRGNSCDLTLRTAPRNPNAPPGLPRRHSIFTDPSPLPASTGHSSRGRCVSS